MAGRNAAVTNPQIAECPARVPVARPCLPRAEALLPYLHQMDEARWYSNFGPLLMTFEQRLAMRFKRSTQVVTCANATQGLVLALKAMNLPAGSLCAMPAFTFVATAHAVLAAGLTPYFLDVDPVSWMLQPETVRKALATAPGQVGAVIPVAPFGAMPDLEQWLAFREETGLPVLVDAAAAFDQATDAILPLVLSLHATKVLGVGEGGVLATTDKDLAARVLQLTTFGFKGTRQSEIAATNAKLSEYAAAVGLAALDGWPVDRLRYLRTAQRMRMAMAAIPQVRFQKGWGVHWVTSVCCVQVPAGLADPVERALSAEGIETRRWWGQGCHTSPAFADCPRESLEHTERIGRSVVGLPFSIDLTDSQIHLVAEALARAVLGL